MNGHDVLCRGVYQKNTPPEDCQWCDYAARIRCDERQKAAQDVEAFLYKYPKMSMAVINGIIQAVRG